MAKGIHTEDTFEAAIEAALLDSGGYTKGAPNAFDATLALDPETLFTFLQSTQPKKWEKISKIHGTSVKEKLLHRLNKEIDLRGMLDVVRKGITDYGVKFDLAYFRPETSLNPETEALYQQNILTVTRQVYYSTKHRNSLDMLLSLNGLPIVTIELKNQFTGQTAENAKRQYRYDRDYKELLFQFKKRALVHFAVDTDVAFMTTRLRGAKTYYLPFNQGYHNGKGNPPNPEGYRTEYLWNEVWQKDSLMQIISKFMHIETEEIEIDGKIRKKETLFFPRYHQMDVVRKLVREVRQKQAGENYLIQHSAGSGKSKSIAWLSYQLFSLHNQENERIYNAVIVITDRTVLDAQLQNTIYQIEHKQGVVQKIDKDSTQLADSLSKGGSIIITTLQKFPFVLDKIDDLPSRNYAVIIDEAHSSQGGEATKKMKEVLSGTSLEDALAEEADTEDEDTALDEIRRSMLSRGKQPNLSFFAFTATPKAKTLEVFGTKGIDGKPRPFHLYSMRQAIEEGFILDVLKNYTTYKTYYKLSKAIEDDPEVNKKKAARAIGRFLSLHPHNLAQKTEVMVEHFRQVVSKQIGGKAKAMVVSGSRLHAVRYKREFDRYIKEKGYGQGDRAIKTLVAFSGKVIDEGVAFTEPEMNGFGYKELRKKFDTDEYQILLVADKYQTGFDQPLLHTMYVDKKLSGVKAVQTLSRLNRTTSGKEDTFVLDFVNDRESILQSFQPFYEVTTVEENTDPNHLYDLKSEIDKTQVIWETEVDKFVEVYFSNVKVLKVKEQRKLNAYVDPAVERFKGLPEEAQDDLKNAIRTFTRLYSFLSQIMPFQDMELEKLFTYLRYFQKKLPKPNLSDRFQLTDEVALEYYRLQKIEEGQIALQKGEEGQLSGVKEAGVRYSKEEVAPLSTIIEVLNEKLGTDFKPADQLFLDQVKEDMIQDETLAKQAKSNTKENFRYGFEDIFMDKLIERMEQNQEVFNRLMDDDRMAGIVKEMILDEVFERLGGGARK
ncbi:type I restriction endonuclease subunit R [Phaeodactylibacter luteus]|uniref:Type I restriction endonuclease subunit R n=1 Tax=Phaeodactylibacter luteus TaxID=1564516 RepID=A0A5C6RGZ1_9BACT|nr:DEAD/DEAH box helicase family protein [Phaeodactylibacter luteus]TXB61718.1 type I restriction endonuclease subunit R [Phaeodactylibacter luteus]